MPIYEYECTGCGKIEEALQKFSDAPLTRCKHCSGELHKLISNTAFHLKGSGWYVTDYKSSKTNSGIPAKTGTETPSAAGSNKPEKTTADTSS